MGSSRNYTELEQLWVGWRNVTGKLMREKYAQFVELSNEGVRELGERKWEAKSILHLL